MTSWPVSSIFLCSPLFSTALWDFANSRPAHSLMLSSHLFFFCLLCLLPIVLCKMVLTRSVERETCPYHFSLRLFTVVRRSSCGPIARWILAQTSSLARILLCSCAVRFRDSQACMKMDVTREHISPILELRKMLQSIQTGLTLSMLLSSVLSLRVPRVFYRWNPHQIWLSPCTWSLRLSQASVHLLWSPCWCRWCCLSSASSSRHWSACCRLWRLCWDAQLILPVLPFQLSHRCHQQSENWWFFCLQCWQYHRDLLSLPIRTTFSDLHCISRSRQCQTVFTESFMFLSH